MDENELRFENIYNKQFKENQKKKLLNEPLSTKNDSSCCSNLCDNFCDIYYYCCCFFLYI